MKGYAGSKTDVNIRDLWQTPEFIFNHYNARFNFTTDVAATWENRLCDDHRGLHFDALLTGWGESNWCNPPYSDVTPFIKKAIEEAEKGCTTVMLLNADTSVEWFKLAYDNCSEMHLIKGRISFINALTKKPVNGNNKGQVVFVFNPKSPFKQQVMMIERDSMK